MSEQPIGTLLDTLSALRVEQPGLPDAQIAAILDGMVRGGVLRAEGKGHGRRLRLPTTRGEPRQS